MLSSNNCSLSAWNAPNLKQLDKLPTCRTGVSATDDVSLSDHSNSVEAFPVIVSAMEETIQTTDPDQPLTEQSSSRLTPISILTADTVGALRSQKILKVLFDPGSTYTFINKRVLPRECKPFQIKKAKKINTINGSNLCNEMVILRDIRLPEFDKADELMSKKPSSSIRTPDMTSYWVLTSLPRVALILCTAQKPYNGSKMSCPCEIRSTWTTKSS